MKKEKTLLFESAKLRTLEQSVPTLDILHAMAAANSADEAARILFRRDGVAAEQAPQILQSRKNEIASDLFAAADLPHIRRIFFLPQICADLKLLLRARRGAQIEAKSLVEMGELSLDYLAAALRGDAVTLPAWMERALGEAARVAQMPEGRRRAEAAIESACALEYFAQAEESGNTSALRLGKICVDGLNVCAALRQTGEQRREFFFLPNGTQPPAAFSDGLPPIPSTLRVRQWERAVRESNPGAAQCALAEELAYFAQECLRRPYGDGVVVGFLLQMELRFAAARVILAQKGEKRGTEPFPAQWEALCG